MMSDDQAFMTHQSEVDRRFGFVEAANRLQMPNTHAKKCTNSAEIFGRNISVYRCDGARERREQLWGRLHRDSVEKNQRRRKVSLLIP